MESQLHLIARFNADGTRDESFLPTDKEIHLKSSPNVDAIWKAPDGSLYLGGSFGGYDGGFKQKRLIHINADGTLDRSFHQPQLDGFIKSISPFGEDKILVGGDFLTTESGDRFLTCVINKDGSLDESYNPRQNFFTENHEAESLAVFWFKTCGRNVIIVGGDVVTPGNAFFHVLTKDGKDFSSTLKNRRTTQQNCFVLKNRRFGKICLYKWFLHKSRRLRTSLLRSCSFCAIIVPDGINATNINKVEPSVRYNNGMLTVNGIEGNAELSVYSTKALQLHSAMFQMHYQQHFHCQKEFILCKLKMRTEKTYTR